jgi:TRAP-type C4-dicarboxylate transport system permease small subunit
VFLAGAAVSLDDGHLSVDVFLRQDAGWVRRLQELLSALVILIVSAAGMASSWSALSIFLRSGQKSVAAGIPMIVPHSGLFAGFALFGAIALIRLVGFLIPGSGKGEGTA